MVSSVEANRWQGDRGRHPWEHPVYERTKNSLDGGDSCIVLV
jgi:hypothetical protein